MKNKINQELVTPIVTRMGTATAAIILSQISDDTSLVQELGSAIAAILLIGWDLVFSKFINKGR